MKTLLQQHCAIEPLPPHFHRRDVAEVAIKAFKQHLFSIIAGVATNYPMHKWKRLLPQDELTLNLLHKSNTTPTVSSYAEIFGPFYYNRMTLGLMGYAIIIHEKYNAGATWDNHTVYGCYLYTSPYQYRAHVC